MLKQLQSVPTVQTIFNLRGWNPRPVFRVEAGWLPKIFCLAMQPHWQHIQCGDAIQDLKGTSYLLFPAPTPGCSYSAHFDATSPYFHAFFGVYVIPSVDGQRLPPEIFAELGNRDNLGWLRRMGDPSPVSIPTQIEELEQIETDRWSFQVTYKMHSGLGDNMPQSGIPELFIAPSDAWDSHLDSYQELHLTSYGFIWYEGNYLVMNFFNGIEFQDKAGRFVNTMQDYPELRSQMERMASAIKIINDGTDFSSPPVGNFAGI